jgi:hypothetical protein
MLDNGSVGKLHLVMNSSTNSDRPLSIRSAVVPVKHTSQTTQNRAFFRAAHGIRQNATSQS